MKVVVFSDSQFHQWKEFSRTLPNGRNSRFQDQLNVQSEIFDYCIQNGVQVLVHCGDLFEALTDKIDKATFLEVFDNYVWFSKYGIIVILLVGNHDFLDRTETSHIIEPFKEIDNIIVVDKPRTEIIDKIAFSFVPHSRENFSLNEINKNPDKIQAHYLFTHQGVSGAKIGPRDMILKKDQQVSDFQPQNFDLIFNGHYHKPQYVLPNFIIIGSPLQKDFGERNDNKGFWTFDTDLNNPCFIETHGPKFFKIETNRVENFKLPEKFNPSKDFLWLITNNNVIAQLPEVVALGDRVRIDIQIEKEVKVRTGLNINMSVEEQIKHYVSVSNTELDKDRLSLMGIDKWKRSI